MTDRRAVPTLAWPGWPHLRLFVLLAAAHTAWFLLVYGGCDYVAGLHSRRVPVHMAWELSFPFWPPATLVYMSIYLPFVLAPFVLRTRRELIALTVALFIATGAAGVCFLLIPAELAYPPPPDVGAWRGLFRFADWLNLRYNLVPSLHVTLVTVCLAAFARGAGAGVKAGCTLWALVVGASTLLTHQHHVVDVLAGFALAIAAHRFAFVRWARASGPPD